MGLSSLASRRYFEELTTLIGKKVEVECSDGKVYRGNLLAISETLNVVLGDMIDQAEAYKLVISGSRIREIRLVQRLFDLRELSERIARVFPGNVVLREDIGAILVMNRIKVTEAGVVEGSGPAADKVRRVYDEYVREMREAREKPMP